MIFKILSPVFEENSFFYNIDYLMEFFYTDRHELWIDDIEAFEKSGWLSGSQGRARERHLEVIEKLIVKTSAYSTHSSGKAKVVVGIPDQDEYTQGYVFPDDAVKIAEQPLRIILENSASDGAFLSRVLKLWERDDIIEAISDRWIEYVNAGGKGEVLKRLKECIPSYHNGPIRAVVLLDSDCLEPESPDPSVNKVQEDVKNQGLACHVLKRREIENYIAPELIQKECSDKDLVSAYARLNFNQRTIFDVKKGISYLAKQKKFEKHVDEKYFKDCDQTMLKNLAKGFGSNAWLAFQAEIDDIKSEFKFFKAWCNHDVSEFDHLIDIIDELL